MPYQRDLEPFSKQLTIIIGLTVVGFMTFGLALSFYRNILFQQTLTDLDEKNQQVAADIAQDYKELEYVNSDQYKDKYAKENLARVNVGEKVLLIAQSTKGIITGSGETLGERDQREAAYLEVLRQMPISEHWNLYLLHRDKLEELKKGL